MVWSEDEPFKTPYNISFSVKAVTLCSLHCEQYHSVNSFQKDTANEQYTNKWEIDCSVSGQNGQVGESIICILYRRLFVFRILCINLNWNTDNLTSFVTAKGSEYILRRCDGSKPHLMSLFSAVGGGRFFPLINRWYMTLHVRFSTVGVEEERFPVCDFKSSFQALGIADKSP